MARPPRLNDNEIAALVAAAPEWELRGGAMSRTFQFADFSEAFGFMSRVALVAETIDHHPEWSNVWNRVEIAITTHDADGLTEFDAKFIEAVDKIASKES